MARHRRIAISALIGTMVAGFAALAAAAADGQDAGMMATLAGSAWAVLPLGFAVGMLHALEADHLAAVATLLNDKGNRPAVIARGAFWGLGHTLALFTICTGVVLVGAKISPRVEASLELIVGIMIVALSLQLLWRMRNDHAHIHIHEHDGSRHLHLHTHSPHGKHSAPDAHAHSHRQTFGALLTRANLKALGVGLVHGAAGSAGLLVLMVATTQSFAQSLLFLAIFGIGSMAGMAAVSAAASLPLGLIQSGGIWLRNGVSLTIALGALWVGGTLAFESMTVLHIAGL